MPTTTRMHPKMIRIPLKRVRRRRERVIPADETGVVSELVMLLSLMALRDAFGW